MIIRRAETSDIPALHALLAQVNAVHHEGRPDLFKKGEKYSDDQLIDCVADDMNPIFVAEHNARVVGYAFCQHQQLQNDNIRTPVPTLYIDDLCVDSAARGQGVGTLLYEHVLAYAREHNYYNVTLNVWSCNPCAQAFYEHLGLKPYQIGMEQILL